MITQNKGEWSELYVFLKLLGDGVLYAADADLNKIEDLYYPLIEILRKENNQIKHYEKDDINIKVIDDQENLLLELPAKEFEVKAGVLLTAIKENPRGTFSKNGDKKGAFSVPAIEDFMKVISCTKVKAPSDKKIDITLVLHDRKTYVNNQFGFSIKSDLGEPPTLFNSDKNTNFTYEIIGKLTNTQIKNINEINSNSKLRDRLNLIKEYNCKLKYAKMEHKTFKANLQMIDSAFPLIISEFLLQYYGGNGNQISVLTPKIRETNPCNLNTELPHLYYEHKMKNFLTDVALGMTPATPWNGSYQATGGYIIVREDGEILCYHVYNHNEFQEYLFNNTRLETPSTSKYDFGYIYQENGKNYIKLNLQIRFI